jgi:hypothetical protein
MFSYFKKKNSFGISRWNQITWAVKSVDVSFFSRKLKKDNVVNIYFIIQDLQGDIMVTFVVCLFGKSIKFVCDLFVDWWKDRTKRPYIVYWKMIGKRYWER